MLVLFCDFLNHNSYPDSLCSNKSNRITSCFNDLPQLIPQFALILRCYLGETWMTKLRNPPLLKIANSEKMPLSLKKGGSPILTYTRTGKLAMHKVGSNQPVVQFRARKYFSPYPKYCPSQFNGLLESVPPEITGTELHSLDLGQATWEGSYDLS